uniref:Uncharacterized protein n=1 Tax=Roseihalotalea indica TaxID=2867963 RepID=A0AA49GQ88_9BACT|nr:hypothetical protein K4G66_30765 [Tunicatimonas sp. TK19036]
MKKFYVKNTIDQTDIYRKLVPLPTPKGEFTYESTDIIAKGNQWQMDRHDISYRDLLSMYEDGYYTIEKEEFERAEALLKLRQGLIE